MAHMLEPLFRPLPHSQLYAHGVAVVLAFVLITYLVVILGEVVPKSIALQRTERVALAVAGPMDVFMTVAAPFLAFMTASTQVVLKAFGTRLVREGGVHSPEELKLIVSASRRLGIAGSGAGGDDPSRARSGEHLGARDHGAAARYLLAARATCRWRRRCSAWWTSSIRGCRFTIRSAGPSTSSACSTPRT